MVASLPFPIPTQLFLLSFVLLLTFDFGGITSVVVAQEYQQYRPPPTSSGSGSSSNSLPSSSAGTSADPLFSSEVDPLGGGGGSGSGSEFSSGETHLNTVKRVISHLSVTSSLPGVRHRVFEHLHVDGTVGYPMKDILVPKKDGTPVIDLHKLNMNVPSLRSRTNYKPGKRRYTEHHTSTVLEIDRGFVYAFGDDIVVADSSRVFVMGGCGDNMAGWALASTSDGQEWDSPGKYL